MSGSTSTTASERAFVLGLDGVPWHLIERWTDEGALPNFARLREEGASGPLDSTRPATTPLAWPSIATGVWPDKHGIYGFQQLSSSYSHRMYTSRDCKQPPLWEQLGPAVVGNVPMTYPATDIDGEVVAGMMTPSLEHDFTHPPELADEIVDCIPDYQISLNYPDYADRLDEFEVAVSDILRKRRELMRLLMERRDDWELFFFVYTAPDRFQHLIWDEDRILEQYRALDDILGEVMDYTDEHDADLYVVSDHGFGPIDELTYPNHFLEREGYLFEEEDDGTRGALASLGISRERVSSALNRIGISEEFLVSKLPRQLLDSVAEQIPGQHALYDVDYERTVAFVHDAGNLYVNDSDRFDHGVVSPREISALKAELTDLFESITDDAGERVFVVYDGDDLFPTDPDSPDLIVNGTNRYEGRNAITDEPFGDPSPTAASHRPEGIMLCRGPSIEPGATLRGARVVDVAPTLLHGIGKPVPTNADGRVLFDAFRPDAEPTGTKVARRDVTSEREQEDVDDDFSGVEDRLKGLGYME
ncbi:alkaline phosphatase family protein [Natronosalvus rutilus]|uniref:Alkaline phosphatase family protein n=1 Tax=Natronosalvus rutilus TaxID=2953753 RepID=A0A9E7NBU0_9EURY|nr:alkaline phosphatase family protein [Natronosalvus rutilus]UTF55020.1 alkaline phosphatase family protein [Natronosalvus rutilus]